IPKCVYSKAAIQAVSSYTTISSKLLRDAQHDKNSTKAKNKHNFAMEWAGIQNWKITVMGRKHWWFLFFSRPRPNHIIIFITLSCSQNILLKVSRFFSGLLSFQLTICRYEHTD
ncbi:hypothetical protein, partial [Candidatus Hodgkinia cicadicola]|uniref:hypothetical protein n=1 Tax=Candidatus Hodgkinia cicadicola TaxID=573658 RepID=UPI002415071F